MQTSHSSPAKSHRKKLTALFLGALATSFLTVGVLLFFYNPDGRTLLSNVVPAPETLQQFRYEEQLPGSVGRKRFVFDELVFSAFDQELQHWKTRSFSIEEFAQLYRKIAPLKSLSAPQEIGSPPAARIAIMIHSEEGASGRQSQTIPFQELYLFPDEQLVEVVSTHAPFEQRLLLFHYTGKEPLLGESDGERFRKDSR